MTHSATPWRQRFTYGCDVESDDGQVAACENKEDAAFIVHAVNNHAELVAALTELSDACFKDFMGTVITEQDGDDEAVGGGDGGDMAITFGMIRRARAALAKALNTPAMRGGA